MEYAFVILLGLCFGSFVTMASYRLPRDESIWTARSYCPSCRKFLAVKDLVPVFSWVFSGGKCRQCKAKISPRYLLTELACAALFVLVYMQYGLSLQALVLALFATALLTMLVADLETKLIPDEIHLFLIPLGIFWHWLEQHSLLSIVTTVATAGGIGLLLHYGYYYLRGRHGLGFGDVKFLFVAGLWIGSLEQLSAFIFYSGVLGVLTGILWKFISKDPRFPFGPALAISLLLLVIWPSFSSPFWELVRGLL